MMRLFSAGYDPLVQDNTLEESNSDIHVGELDVDEKDLGMLPAL